MVAEHIEKPLACSLVRLPLSGTDKSAGSSCLDLGSVSTMAAVVQVPRTFLPSLTESISRQNETTRNTTVTGQSNEISCGLSSGKTLRLTFQTRSEVARLRDQLVPIQTSIGTVLIMPLQNQTRSSPSAVRTGISTNQLLSVRNSLLQENSALRQRLALFQKSRNPGLKRL